MRKWGVGSELETDAPLYQKGPSLRELTPLVNDLDANASSGCWLEVKGKGGEIYSWPILCCLHSPTMAHYPTVTHSLV